MWDVYSGLDLYVKNLLTSLRAVSQLQNMAIRERHWVQLMKTTQVRARCFTIRATVHSLLALLTSETLQFDNYLFKIDGIQCD